MVVRHRWSVDGALIPAFAARNSTVTV